MANKIIEVTQVLMMGVGPMSPKKRMVGIDHIASVEQGSHGTSVITLETGDKFNVAEPYDELQQTLLAYDA